MNDDSTDRIVRDLAGANPVAASETNGDKYCTLCDEWFINPSSSDDPVMHKVECPWRRSRKITKSFAKPRTITSPGGGEFTDQGDGTFRITKPDERAWTPGEVPDDEPF